MFEKGQLPGAFPSGIVMSFEFNFKRRGEFIRLIKIFDKYLDKLYKIAFNPYQFRTALPKSD
jgi:hypothetical protein